MFTGVCRRAKVPFGVYDDQRLRDQQKSWRLDCIECERRDLFVCRINVHMMRARTREKLRMTSYAEGVFIYHHIMNVVVMIPELLRLGSCVFLLNV